MEQEERMLLGKILGEIYRMQRRMDVPCGADNAQIYGLLRGFEDSIQLELEMISPITSIELRSVIDVLDPIWSDPTELAAFNGFYDIEKDLNSRGVDRGKAIAILTYLKANRQFETLIDKMDSDGSPVECRRFDLDEWDV